MSKPIHPLLRSRWRTSAVYSALLHLVLAGLVTAEMSLLLASGPASPAGGFVFEAAASRQYDEPPQVEMEFASSQSWMAASAADVSDLITAVDDPRWSQALLEADAAAPSGESNTEFITAQVLRAIVAAEQQSPEENLDRLETLSDELATRSSAEAIEQATAALQRWLGTKERATQPAEDAIAGEFDLSTAQLHDILRDDAANGQVRYTAVLLDSAGRTMHTSLTEAEGESVYRVMQLMKDNPLLERVYRGVVLSLLDKLLKKGERPQAESGPE